MGHTVTDREWLELTERVAELERIVGANVTMHVPGTPEDLQAFCYNTLKKARSRLKNAHLSYPDGVRNSRCAPPLTCEQRVKLRAELVVREERAVARWSALCSIVDAAGAFE